MNLSFFIFSFLSNELLFIVLKCRLTSQYVVRRKGFAASLEMSIFMQFIVSVSKTTYLPIYTFRVVLPTLLTLATLLRDINSVYIVLVLIALSTLVKGFFHEP